MQHGPIAVVGVGCVLPDASDPSTFWAHQLAGHTAIRTLSERWPWERYVDATSADADRATSILGAQIREFAFDWRRFRMPPREAERINLAQLMVLQAGFDAVNAVRARPNATTGLFIGATGLGWQRDSGLRIHARRMLETLGGIANRRGRPELVDRVRALLDERLNPVSDDTVVNAAASVAVGRIAMHFDLQGLHYAVDAGFASSLAAVDVAVRALRDRTVDMAVVGGASELLSPLELVAFSRLGGLARDRVAPFDRDAAGTLLGEGAVMFAFKRYEDAVRDGERILAVIRGVGASTDGRGRALVAPNPRGQVLAMRRAYRDAGIDPAQVRYVECHATGTAVGDASELDALTELLREAPAESVYVGSAKPFVGHLRGASGAVGLLRAILVLQHGIVPRQINVEHQSRHLTGPLRLPDRNATLDPDARDGSLVAAVSAFGFGGANVHVVLERDRPGLQRLAQTSGARPLDEPIAIVGMGGSFPGARDIPEFSRRLLEGYDATREVPEERWPLDEHFDPDPERNETSYARLGCFVELPREFDAKWRIPPATAERVDPSHVLALQAADEALRDAGFDPQRWNLDETGVMLAFLPYQGVKFSADLRVNAVEYAAAVEVAGIDLGLSKADAQAVAEELLVEFRRDLPAVTEDTLPGYLGNINAARIAQHYDFHGPHWVLDSACASTHSALHSAITALRHRTCDTVLSGGVWCDMRPEFYVAACRFNALSPTGITPFDASADGFVPGEGAGVFVLRRLSDAIADGQRIHAVIRSVAGSSDGRGRSVLAPSVDGEALAVRRAVEAAGVAADSIGYVECHGTGTALGDVVEVEALSRVYTSPARVLRIGSVKSNIGHLNAAAGVPGLIKAVFAVRDGVIPPSIKVQQINPKLAPWLGDRIAVTTETTAWESSEPRRAGVSGFGVGGSNMHMVVEQFDPARHRGERAPDSPQPRSSNDRTTSRVSRTHRRGLVPVVAVDASDLASARTRFAALVQQASKLDEASFLSFADGTQEIAEQSQHGCRIAIVARTADELRGRFELLGQAIDRRQELAPLRSRGVFVGTGTPSGDAAAMFPGQGPQYVDMLRDAAAWFPEIERFLERADRSYRTLTGRPLRPAIWSDDSGDYRQPDEDIHAAVFVVNVALFEFARRRGFRPRFVIGQSAGELAALCASSVLDFESGLRAIRERTTSVLRLRTRDSGCMVALQCGVDAIRSRLVELPGYAVVAADNGPKACIVSGATPAMHALRDLCVREGIDAAILPVSHAYHSDFIAGARPAYLALLRQLAYAQPGCDIVSTVTGTVLPSWSADRWPEHLASQFVEPVRLRQAIETAHGAGARTFVEFGPKWGLCGFASETLSGQPHVVQATLHPKVGEVEQLSRAVAALYVDGWARLRADVEPVSVSGPWLARLPELLSAVDQPVPEDAVAMLQAMHELLGAFLDRLHGAAPVDVAPLSTVDTPRRVEPAPTAPEPVAPSRPAAVDDSSFERIRASLVAELAAQTGYPPDMLELDLDFEADLGIDTVKQLGVFARVREGLGLEQDPTVRLRDLNTLRKVVEHFVARQSGGGRPIAAPEIDRVVPRPSAPAMPVPVSPSTPTSSEPPLDERVLALLRAAFIDHTGYPEEMLEPDLDLEADIGVDTVKQLAVFASVRERLGLVQDPSVRLRDLNTIRKACRHFEARLASVPATSTTTTRTAIEIDRGTPLRPDLQIVAALFDGGSRLLGRELVELVELQLRGSGQPGEVRLQSPEVGSSSLCVASALGETLAEATVGSTTRRDEPLPAAVRSAVEAVQPRDTARSLARLLWPERAEASMMTPDSWCSLPSFDTVVGGAGLRFGPHATPGVRLAGLLDAVFVHCAFAWFQLSGELTELTSVGALHLAVPVSAVPERVVIHVRTSPKLAGRWRADAIVVDEALQRIAEFRRVGAEVRSATRSELSEGDEAANWNRFCYELRRPIASGDL